MVSRMVSSLREGFEKKRGVFEEGRLRPQYTLWVEGAFLLTQWLIWLKYPNQITLCDTDTVILLTIVIIIEA